MVNKISDETLNTAIDLIFNQGMTCKDASKIIGKTDSVVSKRLKAMGYTMPSNRNGRKKIELPVKEMIAMYESGSSEQAVALHFGVSRDAVRNRFMLNGIKIRNQSEAGYLSASQATVEQRKSRALSANIAVRGSKAKLESRIIRAEFLENNAYEHITGKGEIELKDKLESLNIKHTWQKALGKFSLDFAIGNVALELKSGTHYRGDKDKKNGRIKHLKENGFTTIYLLFENVSDIIDNVDYILDQVKYENLNPCGENEYKIIIFQYERFDRFRNSKGQFDAIEKEPVLLKKTLTRKF